MKRSAKKLAALGCLMLAISAACSRTRPAPIPQPVQETTAPAQEQWTHEELAKSNPLEFLRVCRQYYLDNVRDYQCKFLMRERAGGRLGEQQVIAIKFRESPYSVDMTWLENPAGAKRISYVEGRWATQGRQLALVVPSGLGNLVLPGGLKLDIHGKEFQKASNRSVDQFGFRKTLERIIRFCEEAQGDPAYSLTYAGRGDYEGRPQYMLERRLPYSPGGPFPDRLSVIFLDSQWLTPTAVWSYADDNKQQPLGEFIITDTRYNTGLTDADFE